MPETRLFEGLDKTALLVAYLRAESCIPYAAQIAELTNARQAAAELVGGDEQLIAMRDLFGAAMTELRFHTLSEAIGAERYVLELAGGLSPRGIIFAEKYPRVIYVSSDVANVHQERDHVLSLVAGRRQGTSFRREIIDALNTDNMVRAVRFFPPGPKIAVINEGLLGYKPRAQKLQIASNIRMLLELTGGAWYTTDIRTREEHAHLEVLSAAFLGTFQQQTGTTFADTIFDDFDAAESLMTEAGLDIIRQRQVHFYPLSALNSAIPNEAVRRMLFDQHLWIMTPKGQ